MNPNNEAMRAEFEVYMSENGAYPRAIERNSNGTYRLMQTSSAWVVWQAARAAPAIPQADERPRQWVESEEHMRGAPLRALLARDDTTIIWHHKKPDTSNPVWEVIGQ
jgi:hypothetical protein